MIQITGETLTVGQFIEIVLHGKAVKIAGSCFERVNKSHDFLTEISHTTVIYGVNTGFGPMAQYYIAPEEHHQLQYNLIRSHSGGAGEPLGFEECRALMLTRLNTLSLGFSGVHPRLIEILAEFLNHRIHPFIPQHGGVGASGDLVQLAHLALNLIGEGELIREGKREPAAQILAAHGIEPLKIESREGLAILNGTSVMTGIGLLNCIRAKSILDLSLMASCVINELMESYEDHYSEELNVRKLHPGQRDIASAMRRILKDSSTIKERNGSTPMESGKFTEKVQEYYSLRCVPQILGPVLDTLRQSEQVLADELNSVSDNPVVDPINRKVLHGGNFHGDYVSLAMDKLRIALTKVSMLAERQVNYLAADYLNEKLPKFLNPGKLGLNFGIQGIQFTATSTVAENQALSTPMYIHSIPTNSDNQDVVSMGTNSALLTSRVIENCFQVLSVEWIAVMRAYYLLPQKNLATEKELQKFIPYIPKPDAEDLPLYGQIGHLCDAFRKGLFTNSDYITLQ